MLKSFFQNITFTRNSYNCAFLITPPNRLQTEDVQRIAGAILHRLHCAEFTSADFTSPDTNFEDRVLIVPKLFRQNTVSLLLRRRQG